MGDQPPGQVDRVQRDPLDSREVGIAEGRRVIDERLDDQVVLDRLAVGIVGEGVDPSGPGRTPRGFGQLLDRAERPAGVHRALFGSNGNQRRIGRGVGVLQRFECGELRVVFGEHAAVVVRDADEAGASRHDQHEQRGERGDQPAAAQDGRGVAVQSRRSRRRDHHRRRAAVGSPMRVHDAIDTANRG